MRLRHTARRSGFTLVELMVAAALTILIMAVLATGFQVGLQSLSHLKSAGDLADRLRTTETMLRLDLDAPHFDNGSNPGSLPLSELGIGTAPAGGFVQIRQGGASVFEGIDQDSLSSTRAQNHGLSLTVRRTGKTPGDLFAAPLNGTEPAVPFVLAGNPLDVAVVPFTHVSEWAEVHWFLDTTRPILVNGVTTFPLCRRVRVLTPTTPVAGMAANNPTLLEVVSNNGATPNFTTNNLTAIANPANRLAPAAFTPASPRFGDDIVITNVVSFEVKPTGVVPGLPTWPRPALGATALNADFPFDDLPQLAAPNGPLVQFDTALGGFAGATLPPTPGAPPIIAARITGVQIKIRVYDAKNKLTRQSVVTSKL